jgi:hypothetical protein
MSSQDKQNICLLQSSHLTEGSAQPHRSQCLPSPFLRTSFPASREHVIVIITLARTHTQITNIDFFYSRLQIVIVKQDVVWCKILQWFELSLKPVIFMNLNYFAVKNHCKFFTHKIAKIFIFVNTIRLKIFLFH